MKNNKPLIIIGLIILNALVVFMVGQKLLGKASSNDLKIAEARKYAEEDLCSKAITAYNEAISANDTVELRLETIEVYKRGLESGEFTNAYDVITAINDAVNKHRESPEIYEAACELLMKYNKYEECAALLMQARDFNVTSDAIGQYTDEIRYKYTKYFAMYSNVLPLFDGMYTVDSEGVYSFLNEEASPTLKGGYVYASSFAYGYVFVQKEEADGTVRSFILNKKGERQAYYENVETSSGVGKGKDSEGNDLLLLACKVDGSYKYYDITGKVLFGDYAFAGRFRNNVAAVMDKDGKWQLINACGEPVSPKKFSDVVLNEFDECCVKGYIFAKETDRYHLYHYTNLEQIGTFSCDLAKAFMGEYAAFKEGDLWGFVDTQGNVVIQPQFEDAKSFSYGVGAIYEGGLWYLIGSDGMRIGEEDAFEDVGYLGKNGVCFVKTSGHWSYLKFYYTGE